MAGGGTGWEAPSAPAALYRKTHLQHSFPTSLYKLFCHCSGKISTCQNSEPLSEACEQSIPTVNFKCRLVWKPGRPGIGSRGRAAGEQGTCQDASLLVTSCLSFPHPKQAWLTAQRMPHPCLVLSMLPTGPCHTQKSQRKGTH